MFGGLRLGGSAGTPPPPPAPAKPPVALTAKPAPLPVAEFESKWKSLATVEVWGCSLAAAPAPGALEKALLPHAVHCMASGAQGGVHKFYFWGAGEGGVAIAEISVSQGLRLSGVIKAASPALGAALLEAIKDGIHDSGLEAAKAVTV